MLTKKLYEQLLHEYITPHMFRCGFVKDREQRAGYLRWEGDCLWTLYCGFRMERNRDEGWVAVSVCVGFRSLDEFLKEYEELGGFEPGRPCAMGTLTEHLREGPPYPMIQWRLLPDTNLKPVAAEVLEEIDNYALPYFDRYGSLEKAVAAWEAGVFYNAGFPHGDCYLAAAYWLKGERQRAVGHLERRLADWRALYEKERSRSGQNMIERYQRFLGFMQARETVPYKECNKGESG